MVKNLVERTRARMESRKVEGEQGSLILDILIGMAIFALIAIIAVSAIGQYRERAYVQGASSDVNALGLALEAQFTDTFQYPADATLPTAASLDSTMTSGNEIAVYDVKPDGESFTLCVVHKTGGASGTVNAAAFYDSAAGGLVGTVRGAQTDAATACAAAAA